MRTRWWVLGVWICAVLRLAFYATALPLWEGYDEWAHFAVVRLMTGGRLLVARDEPLPPDVDASLQTAPVPWELRWLPPPAHTHDANASGSVASARPAAPWPRLTAYEALQPPLYYWLMTPLLWLFRHAALASQVLALRYAGLLLASATIPLVFRIGRETFADDRLALGCAAVVAVMPGFALDVARVANDALAVPLFTLLLLLAARRAHWLVTGIVLGLGLLTKAYFLAALAVIWWMPRALLPAIAIGGWWYARNWWMTGTLSGLSEAVLLRGSGVGALVRAARALPWKTAVDSILFSHLYFGGWSSLTVRSWMYHLFYLAILAAGAGLALARPRGGLRRLAILYAVFWAAELYNAILIYMSKGVPTSMGWYLYAVIGAEVTLAVHGLRTLIGRWAPAPGVLLFALLDLYAMHFVAIPYYTGMIGHRPNGTLAALHLAEVHPREMLARLTLYQAPIVTQGYLVVLWALYLAATAALVWSVLWDRPSGVSGERRSARF